VRTHTAINARPERCSSLSLPGVVTQVVVPMRNVLMNLTARSFPDASSTEID
jgi:hypothetical protein